MPFITWKESRIFYREQGEGPLLLILPGNTASSICHQDELDYFGERYHVASFDYLGTGQSDRISGWQTTWWADAASQAIELVKHLGHERCIIMGTSGGAVIALMMAIQYPEIVQAVIADSCVSKFSIENASKMIKVRKQRTPEQIRFWEYAHGSDWEQVVEADTKMLIRFAEEGGNWFGPELKEIQCPVLLTASKQDDAIPEIGKHAFSISDQIPNCRLFINNAGGHPLMWSSSKDFRYICNSFLSDIQE
ncbi:MAG: alpha/beta hydrolase [Tissierellales bacterium]|nr:alpha/beta hydrolase [Tissierellales bacterium]